MATKNKRKVNKQKKALWKNLEMLWLIAAAILFFFVLTLFLCFPFLCFVAVNAFFFYCMGTCGSRISYERS